MPGDNFQKVNAGEKLVFPAPTYNAMIDAAIAHKKEMQSEFGGSRVPNTSPGIILVENDSGDDLDILSVVGLTVPQPTPTDNEEAFVFHPSLVADAPTLSNNVIYGILQEPIPDGELGKCLVSGFTVCKLKVIQDWHKYARIVDDETAYLESCPTGDAVIQWAAGTEGGDADYGLVAIKTGDKPVLWAKTTTRWYKAEGNGCYIEANPCDDKDGSNVDENNEVKIWLPRNGFDLDPNIEDEVIIPYMMTDSEANPEEGICIGDYLDGKIGVSFKMIVSTAADPSGWEEVTGADGRTVAFNSDPPVTGYNRHGVTENNHDNHTDTLTHGALGEPTLTISGSYRVPLRDQTYGPYEKSLADILSALGVSDDDIDKIACAIPVDSVVISNWDSQIPSHSLNLYHSDTSNWPPWYKVKLIIRKDNSQT